MVGMRLNFLGIGLKGLGGRAVEQMRVWIGDVIIMVRALGHVLVTFAGWESRYPIASITKKAHLGLALIFDAGLINDLSILG